MLLSEVRENTLDLLSQSYVVQLIGVRIAFIELCFLVVIRSTSLRLLTVVKNILPKGVLFYI